MTEPRRLLDEASGLDRTILESACDDGPSAERRRRVMASVGVTTLAVSSTAAAATTWKVVIGIAALTGLGVGAAVMHAQNSRSSPAVTPSVMIVPSAASAVSVIVAPSAPPAPPPSASIVTVVPTPAPRPVVKKTVEAATTPSIAREIELIDRARKSVGNGDGKNALAALDQYDVECPGGALSLEAAVLRIEAHAAAGDHDRAGALARKFLERHPQSAYEARVRVHLPNP